MIEDPLALGTNNAINNPSSPYPYHLLGGNSQAHPYLEEASLSPNGQHYPITAPTNYNSYNQGYPAAGGYPVEGNGFTANDFLPAHSAPWTGYMSDVGVIPTANFAPLPPTGAYAPMQVLAGPSAPAPAYTGAGAPFIDGALPIAGTGVPALSRPTCPTCGRSFSRKADLDRHAKMHRPDARVFSCGVVNCDFSSYRKDKVSDHIGRRHGGVGAVVVRG